MWGGRFSDETSALMKRFNDSFSFDFGLLEEDIRGSVAWVRAIQDAGVLTESEAGSMVDALREILARSTSEELPLDQHEDVHSYVEAMLVQKVGPLAAKLHTGRSRNDQVATDLRLWLRTSSLEMISLSLDLADALCGVATREAATPMPGYTHLKQAEPITFGHWCLAYVEMIARDIDRVDSAVRRADECPLGSGALSGTPLPIDRESLSENPGFSRPTANSIDAVSSRDSALDYVFAATMLLTDLSRLAEDLIFFNSDEARYVELPDSLATGSSRMPQKKNPDLLELIRGHAARSIGELTGLLTLLKGLPLSYNKDLQLDKEPLFRVGAVVSTALPALTELIKGLQLDRDRMRSASSGDLLLSTTLMDILTSRGLPFRTAHEVVSRRIGESLLSGKSLRELGPTDDISQEDLDALSVERALEKKDVVGGTAPAQVSRAAESARQRLRSLRATVGPKE
ncbi:MAG: argininosuccinate lyase [Acidobacteria bacterium]|nr:argininosuccinate lyase [Acidobacteriota bacterium]